MKTKSVKIKLSNGYTDKENITHNEIVFDSVLKGRQLFLIDAMMELYEESESEVLFSAYFLNQSITKFGSLPIPAGTDVILSLDKIDFEDLSNAYLKFVNQNGSPKPLSESKIQLVYGYEQDGVKFDIAEFGNLTTGKDVLAAENAGLRGNRGMSFLVGKEIVRLSQSKGKEVLEGSLSLEQLGEFIAIDLLAMLEHSKIWKQMLGMQRAITQSLAKNSEA